MGRRGFGMKWKHFINMLFFPLLNKDWKILPFLASLWDNEIGHMQGYPHLTWGRVFSIALVLNEIGCLALLLSPCHLRVFISQWRFAGLLGLSETAKMCSFISMQLQCCFEKRHLSRALPLATLIPDYSSSHCKRALHLSKTVWSINALTHGFQTWLSVSFWKWGSGICLYFWNLLWWVWWSVSENESLGSRCYRAHPPPLLGPCSISCPLDHQPLPLEKGKFPTCIFL